MNLDFGKLEEIKNEFGDFNVGRVWGTDNRNYFRFGYWKEVNLEKLQEIVGPSMVIVEHDDHDEDTGWRYSYMIYDHYEWDQIQKRKQQTLSETN